MKSFFIYTTIILSFFLVLIKNGEAVNAEPIGIKTETELKNYLSSGSEGSYFLENSLVFSGRVTIKNNKVLDLNNNILTTGNKTADQFKIEESGTTFTLKNGQVIGGNVQSVGTNGSGFLTVQDSYLNNKIIIENINHYSDEGGFIRANGSDVHFRGNNTLKNGAFNIRAGNMFFENGVFDGETTKNGTQNPASSGTGGLNLSFNGYNNNLRKGKDRQLLILSEAQVKLTNANTSNLPYANNVGNFDLLTVLGSFDATAVGTSLRTTAAYNAQGSINASQRSEIHVKPRSTFKASSTARGSNRYGTLYTYSTGLYVDNPKIFDMRYYAEGLFFYHWPEAPKGYFEIKNMDIAVWDKASRGIGNPLKPIWQNVESMSIDGFDNGRPGTLVSTNKNLEQNFKINDYSRISNDIQVPKLGIDSTIEMSEQKYLISNNSTSITGNAYGELPNGERTGPVIGGKITLKIGTKTYETQTDSQGRWSFNQGGADTGNQVNFHQFKGETVVNFHLEDSDERTDDAQGRIIDRLPPIGKGKLLIVDQDSVEGVLATQIPKDPKSALLSYSDETSSNTRITVSYLTPEVERQDMVKNLGFTEDKLKVKLVDESGNESIVPIPVLVKPKNTTVTDSFVTANDFTYNYRDWEKASDGERRKIVLEQGNVKGYLVNRTSHQVTELPQYSELLQVTWAPKPWKPKENVQVEVKVKNYRSTIQAFLDVHEVKMNVRYFLENTETPIYEDLKTKKPKKSQAFEGLIPGESISQKLHILEDNTSIELPTAYYELVTPKYQVEVNQQTVTTDEIPAEDFTVTYYFKGITKFERSGNLDFGKLKVSKDQDLVSAIDQISEDQELVIVNTTLSDKWKLSASVPKGIYNNDKRYFQGNLVFQQSESVVPLNESNQFVLDQETVDTPLITLNLGKSIVLQQKTGNLVGEYQGVIVWSLVSGPSN